MFRQRLHPAVRQTSKGDTEFDMSVTVLSASGKLCLADTAVIVLCSHSAHSTLLMGRRGFVGGHKHISLIWQPQTCEQADISLDVLVAAGSRT